LLEWRIDIESNQSPFNCTLLNSDGFSDENRRMTDENPVIFFGLSMPSLSASQGIRLVVELSPGVAPATTSSLLERVQSKDMSLIGSSIKKVIPGVLCELHFGGATLAYDENIPKNNKHVRGSVSVCRKGPLPSQVSPSVMICFAPLPSLDGHHLVIGHVIEGLESLTKIERYGSLPLGECSHFAVVTTCGQIVEDEEGS
jgi:cyclophilin family peptidyl-prolyl cis-trans isomerase